MRFMRILEEVNSLPDYLYHVTPTKNLEQVRKIGLQPGQSEYRSETVHLSDDEFTAANYANMRPDVDHVLLRIDMSYLDEEKLDPDDYELENFLERNNWKVAGEHYDSVYDMTWKQSLMYVNQLAYYGEISPEVIETVKSKFLN